MRQPDADRRLQAVTVGELRPYETEVVIVDYDPRWPEWFERERTRLRSALGDTALAIEHTGSTSVPGLPAKPVIDVLLLVEDSAAEERYLPRLERAGYTLRVREPDWYEHRCLRRRVADGADWDVNLHVFSPSTGAQEIERMLRFRDWLRAHDDDRDRYAVAKRELACRRWKYVQHYADAKTAVIEEILARAMV